MQKSIILLGCLIILVGLFWPWLSKLPFGRLPGDIVIDKPGLKIFFPLSSMILVSLLVSLVMWFFRK